MGLQASWLPHKVNLFTARPNIRSLSALQGCRKIWAVVHGGGPAPGSSAAVKGAAIAAIIRGDGIVAFEDGFAGLKAGNAVVLTRQLISRLEAIGAICCGTSRFNPKEADRAEIVKNLKGWGFDGLLGIGGDDTNTTNRRLASLGFPVVGVPKTIDDDVPMTGITHGHFTVVDGMAEAMMALKDDAAAQDIASIFIAELMGRSSGALALRSAKAAGATGIFIPEEFSLNGIRQILKASFASKDQILARTARMLEVNGQILSTVDFIRAVEGNGITDGSLKLNATLLAREIAQTISDRAGTNRNGPKYGLFAVAEGIADRLPTKVCKTDAKGKPIKFEVLGLGAQVIIGIDNHSNPRLADVGIAQALTPLVKKAAKDLGIDLKVVPKQLGYEFRCRRPNSFDIGLGLEEGGKAIELLDAGMSGVMVISKGFGNLGYVRYEDLLVDGADHLLKRLLDLGSTMYTQAADMQMFKAHRDCGPKQLP
ncbi:MAG: 6-phosphofructokinase [Candidatus Saganbacteria bacterium]|nr:6-phosphofructokinase [Candidatus Saganbacteria bacterium]